MIYKFKGYNYKTFKVIEDNVLPPRSYFIPFSSKQRRASVVGQPRYEGDRVSCLSGTWDFHFFDDLGLMPGKVNTDTLKFDKIPVPSCWQFCGYEAPFYLNTRYPFNCHPPKIPTKEAVGKYFDFYCGRFKDARKIYNTAGLYRKFIDVKLPSRNFILSFLGVASAFELYINGTYVGYSEGPHNTAEFDVGSYLNLGQNEIVVLVYKWSNGSYLEAQDMFRSSGIFRDVLLYSMVDSYVYDFTAATEKLPDGQYKLDLDFLVKNNTSCHLKYELLDGDEVVCGNIIQCLDETVKDTFTAAFREYSAEIPTLYTLQITLIKDGIACEYIERKIGFRDVRVQDGVFLFNGKPIKLRGVNHHDTDSRKGYAMSYEDMKRDVEVFKAYNVNTVRTSHYPPDPMFMELCDEYGVYVIAEADIETHGAMPRINRISNDLKWATHYWDRVYKMFMRFKNNPSVTMWSLGNEAGGIKCQDYCYDRLKKLSSIPIHYEGACRSKRLFYDVYSTMYPSVDQMKKWLVDGRRGKPITVPHFLCEYAHAMGTGAGNLQEYWDLIESSPRFMGACIWEFCDHAVYHDSGKYQYTYGGDHGEFIHDGNFCVDGLFDPERNPHTGALNMQYVYRPLTAQLIDQYTLEVSNKNYFADSSDIYLMLNVQKNGEIVSTTSLYGTIEPRTARRFEVFLGTVDGDCFLTIEYMRKSTGKCIATEQIALSKALTEVPETDGKLTYFETAGAYMVKFSGGQLKLDKTTGLVTDYSINGKSLVDADPARFGSKCFATNLVRSNNDNDVKRMKSFLNSADVVFDRVTAKVNNDFNGFATTVELKVFNKIFVGGKKAFDSVDFIKVYGGGRIDFDFKLTRLKKTKELRRVGKMIKLPLSFDDVILYGRSGESYPDQKEYAPICVTRLNARDFTTNEIVPQECGERSDVRYAVMKDLSGKGVMFIAREKPFYFNVQTHSINEIDEAAHREDLPEEESLYVYIDSEVRGVGSGSCGPDTMDKYKIKNKDTYKLSFSVVPFDGAVGGGKE